MATGPDLISRLCPGDHVCWILSDDRQRLRTLAGYLRDGLAEGHKVICLSQALLPRALVAGLERLGVPVEEAVARGQLEVYTPAESFLAGGRFEAAAMIDRLKGWAVTARRQRWSGLRIAGDMSWAAEPVPGREHLAWFEAQANRIFARGYAIGLCLYDRGLFTRPELDLLASAHPGTATPEPDSGWEPLLRIAYTSQPAGIRLSGEIDLSNRRSLAAVLSGLPEDLAGHAGPIRIDVSKLRFADAAALALLVRAVRMMSGKVRLVGGSPELSRLLELVANDAHALATGNPERRPLYPMPLPPAVPGRLSTMAQPFPDRLKEQFAALRADGVDVIVSLQPVAERQAAGLAGEPAAVACAGLEFHELPVVDFGVPDRAAAEPVVRLLCDRIREGRHVVVHCAGGIGRSSVVAAAILVQLGTPAAEVWRVVSEARGREVPETDEQRAWPIDPQ
jgi:anti-anti-sigma factor